MNLNKTTNKMFIRLSKLITFAALTVDYGISENDPCSGGYSADWNGRYGYYHSCKEKRPVS